MQNHFNSCDVPAYRLELGMTLQLPDTVLHAQIELLTAQSQQIFLELKRS